MKKKMSFEENLNEKLSIGKKKSFYDFSGIIERKKKLIISSKSPFSKVFTSGNFDF